MPNVQIQVEGLEKLKEQLKNSPKVSKPIIAKAINFSLAELVYNARDPQFLFKTPRSERTGYLELSFSEAAARKAKVSLSGNPMSKASSENLSGSIGPMANYAIYVHAKNPFMLRIVQKSNPKINELFEKALEQITEKLAGK